MGSAGAPGAGPKVRCPHARARDAAATFTWLATRLTKAA